MDNNGLGLGAGRKFYGDLKNVPHVTLSEAFNPLIFQNLYKGKPIPRLDVTSKCPDLCGKYSQSPS